MDKKKSIITGISVGVVIVALSVLVCFRLFGGFNAKEYVNAVCLQMLKGDTEGVTKMTRGLSAEEAEKQQEEMAENFVRNVVASGLELEKEQMDACVEITKKIFAGLEYEVVKSTKIADGEYNVTIAYKESDVMKKLQEMAKEASDETNQKIDKGEYRGTTEEIQQQIQSEFAKKIPDMLEEAYRTMQSQEEETMTLTVKKGENGLYTVDIGKFLIKIMGLTEKED